MWKKSNEKEKREKRKIRMNKILGEVRNNF
jgi:hypothetical protein